MSEFGEQLRKARQDKGMTQQSLAEQLYVARQTISRWEVGERYPDILMLKEIARVLDVEVRDLLSDDEAQHIIERTSVVGKPAVNNVTIILFACIVISYGISIVGVLMRIPAIVDGITFEDRWIAGGQILSGMIGAAAFIAGFVWILQGIFSPKRVGVVAILFYISECIRTMATLSGGAVVENKWLLVGIIAVNVIGIIASYFCFFKNNPVKFWYGAVVGVSLIGMIRVLFIAISMMTKAAPYVSAETAVSLVLALCIYALFIYQARTLWGKRFGDE